VSSKSIDLQTAEMLAIASLSHIATDVEQLGRFLALTGLEAGQIREAAKSQTFLLAVLDFVSTDESLLIAIAANQGFKPGQIEDARLRLQHAIEGPNRFEP
jgi:hypothetical protein